MKKFYDCDCHLCRECIALYERHQAKWTPDAQRELDREFKNTHEGRDESV